MTVPFDPRVDAQIKQLRRAFQAKQVPRTLTAAGSALITDYLLGCDATSAGFAVTLPTVQDARGMVLLIVKTDSTANVVTVAAAGSDAINGANTQTLSAQWTAFVLYCDGTQWIADRPGGALSLSSLAVSGAATVGSTSTLSGSASLTTGTPVALFTLPGPGLYYIMQYIVAATSQNQHCEVWYDGTNAPTFSARFASASLTGTTGGTTTFTATQITGSTKTVAWFYHRFF